jgi:hypothetical protein
MWGEPRADDVSRHSATTLLAAARSTATTGIAFAHHPAAAEAGPEPAGASLRGVRRERATVPFPHLERIPGERCVDVGHRLHPRRVGRKGQRVDPADEREALP